jgi:hypothetical protein
MGHFVVDWVDAVRILPSNQSRAPRSAEIPQRNTLWPISRISACGPQGIDALLLPRMAPCAIISLCCWRGVEEGSEF